MSWWRHCPNGHTVGVCCVMGGDDDDPCDRVSFVEDWSTGEPGKRVEFNPPLCPWVEPVKCPACDAELSR